MKNSKVLYLLIVFLFSGLLIAGCSNFDKGPCAGGCDKNLSCAGKSCKGGKCEGSQCPFECLAKSPRCALKNKEKLGLSDEQVSKIKEIGIETEKNVIQLKADSKKIEVDIKLNLKGEDFSVETINALIDKNSELQKQIAKAIVSSHAQILEMLTPEQKVIFKKIKKECKKSDCCSGDKECSDCNK